MTRANETEAFKVVHQFGRELWSALLRKEPPGVRYRVRRWTEAPACGPLLVFNDIVTAKRFMAYGDRLYRCRVRNAREIEWLANTGTESVLRRFWRSKRPDRLRCCMPAGNCTLACDAVKLLEELL